MKLNREKFKELLAPIVQPVLMNAPMSPQIITGFWLEERKDDKVLSDVEFGWSGIQVLCCVEEAIKIFAANNNGVYAVEGVGYFSLARTMFEEFDQEKQFSDDDKTFITEFISGLVGSSFQGETDPAKIIVVQLIAEGITFPAGIRGFRVHVMIPVPEEYWLGLYQIHHTELQAATKFYEQVKQVTGGANAIAENFSPERTLN